MRKSALALLASLLWIAAAHAQSSPGWSYGTVPTPAQWNQAFAGKQDYLGGPPTNYWSLSGTTINPINNYELATIASASSNAGFNVPPGVAPSSPNNGDIWTTSSGIFAQIGGSTYNLLTPGGVTIARAAANDLAYYTGTAAIGGLTTADNGILITGGSGIPSISTTLPSGLTIPSPTITNSAVFSGTALITGSQFGMGTSLPSGIPVNFGNQVTSSQISEQGGYAYVFQIDPTINASVSNGIVELVVQDYTASNVTISGSNIGINIADITLGSGATFSAPDYGLFISPITAGTSNYSIFTEAGIVSFGDSTQATSISNGAVRITNGGLSLASGNIYAGGSTIELVHTNNTGQVQFTADNLGTGSGAQSIFHALTGTSGSDVELLANDNNGSPNAILATGTAITQLLIQMNSANVAEFTSSGGLNVGFNHTDYLELSGGSGGNIATNGGPITLSPATTVVVSSAPFGLSGNQSAAAWTTNGIRYANVAATLTDTSSSGTVATAYTSVFGGDTIAASSAVTYTNYFGSYFKAPIAGTNVTFTSSYALGADTLNVGTSYYANGSKGVTCTNPLTVVSSITIKEGIVTAAAGTGGTCS